tara:strand:- start:187 stop:519 length:333 start_codon:yes stop_codon:yes gene_type:complete
MKVKKFLIPILVFILTYFLVASILSISFIFFGGLGDPTFRDYSPFPDSYIDDGYFPTYFIFDFPVNLLTDTPFLMGIIITFIYFFNKKIAWILVSTLVLIIIGFFIGGQF